MFIEMFTDLFTVTDLLLGGNLDKVLLILIMVMIIGHVNGGMKGLSTNKGIPCVVKKCSLKRNRKLCSKVTVTDRKAQQQQKKIVKFPSKSLVKKRPHHNNNHNPTKK